LKLRFLSVAIAAMPLAVSAALAADPSAPVVLGLTSGVQLEAALGGGSYVGRTGNASSIAEPSRALWGLALIAGMPIGERFSIQGDLVLDGDFIDASEYTGYAGGFVGAAHLSWRDPAQGLFGAFGGAGRQRPASDGTASLWFFGLEGQKYFSRATLYLQGGILDSSDSDATDAFHNAVFLRGVGRYFLGDMTTVSGELGFASGRQDSSASYRMGITSWGLKLDHMLATYPLSLSAGYEGMHASNGNGGDNGSFTDHRFIVAAKFYFGGNANLYLNDRFGQNLDLPKVGRMVGAGNSVD
jgi:hypothetical protein